jgi:GT2 family glycosyltransferase
MMSTIGIVVIGRNEGERLINCLRSLQSDPSSVVYVDSGSTDGSPQAAARFGVHVVPLDPTLPATAARARNKGFEVIRAVRPDIRLVQFIDGDCELAAGWLNAASAFLSERRDVAVACGRRRERHPSASIYNQLCDLEWDTPTGQTQSCGGDALVRVEAFEAVGGYRAELIAGEEPELCLRLREKGWKIWRLDEEMTRHDAAMARLRQWWIRAVRGGYALAEVSHLHRRSPLAIWKTEFARALSFGCLVPMLIAAATLIHPGALSAATLYPLQVCRIAVLRGPARTVSWAFALFITLAKFAEFQGILTFYWRRLGRQSVQVIEYK